MTGQPIIQDHPRPSDGDRARARLLARLPVTERRLQLSGAATTLLEGGDGPPMILLHGGTDSGGVAWAPLIRGIYRDARVVVPDLPGLGESAPLAEVDVMAFSGWLAEVVRTCDQIPTLIAHSS